MNSLPTPCDLPPTQPLSARAGQRPAGPTVGLPTCLFGLGLLGLLPLLASAAPASTEPADPPPLLHVRANQLGYLPRQPKIAIAFSSAPLPARFTVREVSSDDTVFTRRLQPLPSSNTWGPFTHFARLDFSRLTQPGRYEVVIGSTRSFPFEVGPAVDPDLSVALLEFLRQQRCGDNPWLDATCHPLDGKTAYGPRPAGSDLDARGGWHDAADLLKYLLTSANATAQMLLAWQIHQEAPAPLRLARPSPSSPTPPPLASAVSLTPSPLFPDQVDARGRPGPNRIPDLLDEARWGLDWLHKLHPTPAELYHQVADDRDHYGWRLPQNEAADYGWGEGQARVVYAADGRPQGLGKYRSASNGLANLAGRYAAAMALAYQVWHRSPTHQAFAHRCLQAAREVYDLGRQHEGVQQGNSYRAPYRYAETTWADDMEWGAAELYRATGEPRFLADARRYAPLAHSESWMGREQSGHYQFYPFLNAGHFRLYPLVDPAFQRRLARYYRDGLERCLRAAENHPFQIGVPFIWCSNNLTVALATQGLLYELMTGNQRFRGFALNHRDWLLGRNPWNTTMFTEIGADSPTDVHLMTTRLTQRRVRGGLVDGPVDEKIFKSLIGVHIREPDPLAPFQDPRAVYHDDLGDYSTNEPTMDGTASALLLESVFHFVIAR